MLHIKKVQFAGSFYSHTDLPAHTMPEVAFIGRSNVGKSSLINNLTRQKIAQCSQTPGKTRGINLFLVNEAFYFVDLPGYGYAKVSAKERNKWPKMIESYLENSKNLKTIMLLLDIRRTPNEQDKLLSDWLRDVPDIRVLYILTKSDKLSAQQRQKQKKTIALTLMVDIKDLILHSSTKNMGREEIVKRLDTLLF